MHDEQEQRKKIDKNFYFFSVWVRFVKSDDDK